MLSLSILCRASILIFLNINWNILSLSGLKTICSTTWNISISATWKFFCSMAWVTSTDLVLDPSSLFTESYSWTGGISYSCILAFTAIERYKASILSWLMTDESSWADGLRGLKLSLFCLMMLLRMLSISINYRRCRASEIKSVFAHSKILCSSWAMVVTLFSFTRKMRCSTVLKSTQASNLPIISFSLSSTWIIEALMSA